MQSSLDARVPSNGSAGRGALAAAAMAATLLAFTAPARAQGFDYNRYEPTPAGQWFFAVAHPWYSRTRYFAAGVTLDYGHNPLVLRDMAADGTLSAGRSAVEHALLGHIDLAGSFLDRVTLSASLPITLLQSGPLADQMMVGAAVGDPRFGLLVRLFNQPDKDRVSMSLGAYVWAPIGMATKLSGDPNVRVMPKVILGGVADWLRWSLNVGVLIRPETTFLGNTVGHEYQMGAALAYANAARSFSVGPELMFGTRLSEQGFQQSGTSLEVLVGAQYLIKDLILIGVAPGFGALLAPGTPDFRMLARIAYAPVRRTVIDTDGDGVADKDDACPTEKGVRTGDPATNGCPRRDRDGDGVADRDDLCPDLHHGPRPDPERPGCPALDSDGDGILDRDDLCPLVPSGASPDPKRRGCPLLDRDGDGVLDADDPCPDVHQGDAPDPRRPGCPTVDTDRDGVTDNEDLCPTVPSGPYPDPLRKGCPLSDRDFDTVPDARDACPDRFGAPDPDPKKNGCPGLVEVREGKIRILRPIFFATDKDIILPKSFALLQAVANVMLLKPEIKKLGIEGYTDSRGSAVHNQDLSARRARAVMSFLVSRKVEATRLTATGFGVDHPVATNATDPGRSLNRRVEFNILDPASEKKSDQPGADTIEVMPTNRVPDSAKVPDAAPVRRRRR